MKRNVPRQDSGRVLAVALVFFGGFALLGWVHGVYVRLPAGTLAALALFAVTFAALTWRVDAELRAAIAGYVRAASKRRFLRRAPATPPAALLDATSGPRTSARGSAAAPVRAAG